MGEPRGTRTLAPSLCRRCSSPGGSVRRVESARIELASPGCRPGASPVELRSRRLRGNRTPSPGFGGPAGHHDSAACSKRPVGESNPSHTVDGGIATPVASRAHGVTDGDRTRLRRFTACPRRQTSTATTKRREPSPGVEPDLPAYGAGARPHEPRGHAAAPAEGIEPSSEPVNGRLPDHSASLEYVDGGPRKRTRGPPSFGVELSMNGAVREHGRSVSGAGIEPALLGPEASVLPLDDPEVRVGPEGVEPPPHRLRAGCAAATRRA